MKEVRKANGGVFGKFMSYAGWGIGLASLLIAIYGEFIKKDEPKIVPDRVDSKNAFPAYHMNKQHWYTLFLDERLSDDEIVDLIEKSYVLVNQ